MALEINGKIIKILPQQSGTGRNGVWKKQDFILEANEQFPKKICISSWGDKVNVLSQININTNVKVSINIESREYNEKWYTDVKAWKIEAENNNNYIDSHTDTPFTDTTYDDISGISFSDENNMDDLPF